jgi:23S rRNA (uracil1939-C5)-methyltransferase
MLLSIERIVSGGRALATGEGGKQILVSGALAGEVVEAQVEREHASYTLARCTAVRTPHDRRIEPPCPHWGVCGGCDFQYADDAYQRDVKEEIVVDALMRIGSVAPNSYTLEEGVSSGSWSYRSRARFFVDLHTREAGFLGRSSTALVAMTHCPVLTKTLNALLFDHKPLVEAARSEMFANRRSKSGLIEVNAFAVEERWALLDKELTITVGAHDFTLTPTVFFQSNTSLLAQMGSYVSSLAEGERVMDLYSGVGTFAAFMEQEGRTVIAVERDRRCLSLARRNAPTAHFYTEAAETWAKRQSDTVDTVVVDPPRVGLDASLIPTISSWNPRRIIYVSCDAASLARDVGRFVEQGYTVQSLKLFDLYPQTFHTESVLLLTRD